MAGGSEGSDACWCEVSSAECGGDDVYNVSVQVWCSWYVDAVQHVS